MKPRRVPPTRGFTLVEVLVALTLTGIVVAGTLRALSAQKKFYVRQARILDARHAMRASTVILRSEFRDASASDGDIVAIAPDSVVVRSLAGFAVACDVDGNSLVLAEVSGHFRLDVADSVLVFVENTVRDDDDGWRPLAVTSLSAAPPNCNWGSPASLVLTVSGSLDGVWVGAPVRLYRPYVYSIYEMGGRYWLGRREYSIGSAFIPVAGPLAPPDSGGLQLAYYDASGAETTDPSQVTRVNIQVRAPTYRSASDPDYRQLTTSVYLRNDG